jgi:hypothetical protein
MANKHKQEVGLVIKKTSVVTSFEIIPAGKKWVLKKLIFTDINDGTSQSSVAKLEFGSGVTFDNLRTVVATGATVHEIINLELIGDGVKLVRLTRQNTSNTDKELPFYLDAYEV